MSRLCVGLMTCLIAAMFAVTAVSQPPDGQDKQGRQGRDKGGNGREKGPPRFELGRLLPPNAREQLKLTKDQEQKLDDLEKDVKEKLNKILTDAQKKQLESMRPPGGQGRGRPGQGDKGEGRGRPGQGDKGEGRGRPPEDKGPPPDGDFAPDDRDNGHRCGQRDGN